MNRTFCTVLITVSILALAACNINYPASPTPTAVPVLSAVTLAIQAQNATEAFNTPGQVINYQYAVTNTGNVPLVGPVAVTDDKVMVTCPNVNTIGNLNNNLDPNESINCSGAYTITQADLDTGSVTNNAMVNVGGVSSNPATNRVNTVANNVAAVANPTAAPTQEAGNASASNTSASASTNFVPGSTIQYQVVRGEWLMQIARCYGADFQATRRANPQILNPSLIMSNAIVTVPNIGSNGTIYGPPCIGYHTVQTGDTWNSIAQTYNADVAVLQAANRGVTLSAGRVLKVPLNSAGGTAPTNPSIRITFDPGATSATRTGVLKAQETIRYVLTASQGQTMTVAVTAPANEVALAVYAPNGTVLKAQDTNLNWNAALPANGDYRIELVAIAGAIDKAYTLTVSLNTPPAPTPCNRAELVADVSVPDGTVVPAGSTFTKIWRLKNTGTCTWTTGYTVVWASGERMDAPDSTKLTIADIAPNATVDLPIDLKAPATPGTYQSEFRLRSADNQLFGVGQNGQNTFWVKIVVQQQTSQALYQKLLNKTIDEKDVADFLLTPTNECHSQPPSLNYQCKPVGVELALNSGQRVTSVFMYAQGIDGYAQYAGELPHGLTWDDTRTTAESKLNSPVIPPEIPGDNNTTLEVEYQTNDPYRLIITYRLADAKVIMVHVQQK